MSRMTSKGQVTIPKAVRDRLGLRRGDEVEFVEGKGAVVIRKGESRSAFARYRGHLKHLAGRNVDTLVEDMRDA